MRDLTPYLEDLRPPNILRNDIHFEGMSFPGIVRYGPMKVKLRIVPELADTIRRNFESGEAMDFLIHGCRFKAYVQSFTLSPMMYLDVEFRITGKVEVAKEEKVAPKKVRFYIGKRDVCEGTDFQQWGKGSLPEALEQAKALAEKTDEPFYVVKVIKVVRRKRPPVVVEDVK